MDSIFRGTRVFRSYQENAILIWLSWTGLLPMRQKNLDPESLLSRNYAHILMKEPLLFLMMPIGQVKDKCYLHGARNFLSSTCQHLRQARGLRS